MQLSCLGKSHAIKFFYLSLSKNANLRQRYNLSFETIILADTVQSTCF